jgi:hypothetical protein
MRDETGPKLATAIEKKLHTQARMGRKPATTPEQEDALAREYADREQVTLKQLAEQHGMTLTVCRRALQRALERMRKEATK